ncbi:MAG TPA: hypothetical protein PKE06_08700 [Flavilitoribacter sp.]|nr:hypothetical protein [Flavilitoribacter sp.]HMQ89458.1 hypothetical protein [Flavilitoribacter sp.]
MKKSAVIAFIFCLFAGYAVQAQREETLINNGSARFSGIWGAFSNNYSSFDNNWIYNRGGYGGFEFGRTVFIGFGGYRYREDVNLESGATPFKMKYGAFIIGVSPNSRKAIHPRINILTGRGRISSAYEGSDRIFVVQPSAGLELNVFQWFRVGLEGGYRLVLDSDIPGLENAKVSAPFAQLDLRFGVAWGR